MTDYLNGIHGDVNMKHAEGTFRNRYSREYKDKYAPKDRKTEISTPGTRLYFKEANAAGI